MQSSYGLIAMRYGGSNGVRNPCPDGQYINTLIAETTFADQSTRNITYLICDTNNPNEISLSLILGLSLGLGIPIILTLVYASIKYCFCDDRRRVQDNNNRLLQNIVEPMFGHAHTRTVFDILTPELQRLFSLGILDDNFKRELLHMPRDKLLICRDEAVKNNKHNIITYISVLLDNPVNTV